MKKSRDLLENLDELQSIVVMMMMLQGKGEVEGDDENHCPFLLTLTFILTIKLE